MAGDVSGGLGLEAIVGGWECVKRLDELSKLGVEEMRFELSKLEAGEIKAGVGGVSVLDLLMGEPGTSGLEPVALNLKTGQS